MAHEATPVCWQCGACVGRPAARLCKPVAHIWPSEENSFETFYVRCLIVSDIRHHLFYEHAPWNAPQLIRHACTSTQQGTPVLLRGLISQRHPQIAHTARRPANDPSRRVLAWSPVQKRKCPPAFPNRQKMHGCLLLSSYTRPVAMALLDVARS